MLVVFVNLFIYTCFFAVCEDRPQSLLPYIPVPLPLPTSSNSLAIPNPSLIHSSLIYVINNYSCIVFPMPSFWLSVTCKDEITYSNDDDEPTINVNDGDFVLLQVVL